jgi:tetratricopeptide (TPR) repeat protein
MSAVVGVLNESLTEAIKSFYKLRKAYLALEGVMENEKKFLKDRSTSSANSMGSGGSSRVGSVRNMGANNSRPPTSASASAAASTSHLKRNAAATVPTPQPKKPTDDDDDDDDFVDAEEDRRGDGTPVEYMGHLNINAGSGENPLNSIPDPIKYYEQLVLNDEGTPEADLAKYSDHPVDVFILSGSNFCFGMLLLILSFIPPSFSSLLKIVGFKGDRDRGMKMLWQATKFHNIHGAMAGVVLMGYLNGFTNFCDILPEGAYPKERCVALLRYMRARYPKSHLWLLEESRMLASEKQLEKAVQFVADAGESPLKQLEALSWFERSLNNMYMHDYAAAAFAFEKCITLNNWSHGLYYHIIAASYVELYRQSKTANNSTDATTYKEKADHYLKLVIPNCGKKKFMARQLPFDIFVVRKIQKWEARAKEWNCDLVDAVGVSPLEEMIFFWNGYKRMREDHLQVSLSNLAWSESAENPYWEKEGVDEHSILNVLRAATLRNMGRMGEAKAILEKSVLPLDRALFVGGLKDNWTAPCARYEMAANIWQEADGKGKPRENPEMLGQCRDWLEEVTKWGGFDLDARYVFLRK